MNILDDTCTMYSINVFDKQDNTDSVEFVEEDEPLSRVLLGLARILGSGTNFNGGFGLTKSALTIKDSSENMDSYIRESDFYWRLLNTMKLTCECFKRHNYIENYVMREEVKDQTIKLLDLLDSNNDLVLCMEAHWLSTGSFIVLSDYNTHVSDVLHKLVVVKLTSLLSSNVLENPKDLYDIHCLNQCYCINTRVLAKFMVRKINCSNYPASANKLRNWLSQYNTLQLVDAATQTSRLKPNFFTVIRDFVNMMYNLYYRKEMELCPCTYLFYNEYKSRSMYPYDKLVGSHGEKYVVMFDRALWHAGLIKDCNPQLILACLGNDVIHVDTFMTTFINNPWFQWYDYTTPSPKSENILYPNAERALVDSIIFVDQCDQGVLIESLRNYYDRYQSWDGLHEMLKHYHEAFDHTFIDFYSKFKDKLNYWISEAEDYSNED